MRSVGTARRIDQLGRVVDPGRAAQDPGDPPGRPPRHPCRGRSADRCCKIDPECAICGSPDRAPAAAREADLRASCVVELDRRYASTQRLAVPRGALSALPPLRDDRVVGASLRHAAGRGRPTPLRPRGRAAGERVTRRLLDRRLVDRGRGSAGPTTMTCSPRGIGRRPRVARRRRASPARPPRSASSAPAPRATDRCGPHASSRSASVAATRCGDSKHDGRRLRRSRSQRAVRRAPSPSGAGIPRSGTGSSAGPTARARRAARSDRGRPRPDTPPRRTPARAARPDPRCRAFRRRSRTRPARRRGSRRRHDALRTVSLCPCTARSRLPRSDADRAAQHAARPARVLRRDDVGRRAAPRPRAATGRRGSRWASRRGPAQRRARRRRSPLHLDDVTGLRASTVRTRRRTPRSRSTNASTGRDTRRGARVVRCSTKP